MIAMTMPIKTLFQRTPFRQRAIALAGLLAVAEATAMTEVQPRAARAVPANLIAPAANPRHAITNLTPAATVSVPSSRVLGDIREIRPPRPFPTSWLWVGMAAGVVTLIAAARAAWQWLQHGKYFEMTPGEIALQRLEEIRPHLEPDQARDHCCAVSQIIRRYLEAQCQICIPRLTTEEFLRERAADSEAIATPYRALLGDFLRQCELAKSAGWQYSRPALAELHASATDFVRQLSAAAAAVRKTPPQPTPCWLPGRAENV